MDSDTAIAIFDGCRQISWSRKRHFEDTLLCEACFCCLKDDITSRRQLVKAMRHAELGKVFGQLHCKGCKSLDAAAMTALSYEPDPSYCVAPYRHDLSKDGTSISVAWQKRKVIQQGSHIDVDPEDRLVKKICSTESDIVMKQAPDTIWHEQLHTVFDKAGQALSPSIVGSGADVDSDEDFEYDRDDREALWKLLGSSPS